MSSSVALPTTISISSRFSPRLTGLISTFVPRSDSIHSVTTGWSSTSCDVTTSALGAGSHSITADRGLAEQVRDLEFFESDAIIVTGRRLADPPVLEHVGEVRALTDLAVVVGSGVTPANVGRLMAVADAAIVGSSLKEGGAWYGAMSRRAAEALVEAREAGAAGR